MLGLGQKHNYHGLVVFLHKHGNGVGMDHYCSGDGSSSFFEEFLAEDKEGSQILEFFKSKFTKCKINIQSLKFNRAS